MYVISKLHDCQPYRSLRTVNAYSDNAMTGGSPPLAIIISIGGVRPIRSHNDFSRAPMLFRGSASAACSSG